MLNQTDIDLLVKEVIDDTNVTVAEVADPEVNFTNTLADVLDCQFEDINDPDLYTAVRAVLVARYPAAWTSRSTLAFSALF